MMGIPVNSEIGAKFGTLTVVDNTIIKDSNGKRRILVRCDCGNELYVIKSVFLRSAPRSCGCVAGVKHGLSRTRQYKIWADMTQRCKNDRIANFKYYGGRGIKVCEEWLSFDAFWKDMGDGYSDELTLDRIDVDGDYCKENCRWATKKEQSRNKRGTVLVTAFGITETTGYWHDMYGVKVGTILDRIRHGWSSEDAVTKPKMRK